MKPKLPLLFLALALLCAAQKVPAQTAHYFRPTGPADSGITAFLPDGILVWSNALKGATYTFQTVAALPGGTNWVNYAQMVGSNFINTNRLLDFSPPSGMALIPAGPFTLGASLDGESDAPLTSDKISAFYMDVNLVTYGQWQSVYTWATNHGFGLVNAGAGKAASHPVQTVNWFDVVKWCNARSVQAGKIPVYYTETALTHVYTNFQLAPYVNWTANGYRLPSEAEWEKAARGGLSGQRFPWGKEINETRANYYASTTTYNYDLGPSGDNATYTNGVVPYTSPVGSFAANGYGLDDMAGNVFAWCWDWYATAYSGGSDPHGPANGTYRTLRGGAWNSYAYVSRCAYRGGDYPISATSGCGFRCVKAY